MCMSTRLEYVKMAFRGLSLSTWHFIARVCQHGISSQKFGMHGKDMSTWHFMARVWHFIARACHT